MATDTNGMSDEAIAFLIKIGQIEAPSSKLQTAPLTKKEEE